MHPSDEADGDRTRERTTPDGVSVPARPVAFEFMDRTSWFEFHCELYSVVESLGFDVDSIGPGVIRLRSGASVPLLDLSQHAVIRPRSEWRDLIERHVETVSRNLDLGPGAFSSLDLRVRLVVDTPDDAVGLRSLGARPFVEGVAQVLCVDVDDAVRCVSAHEIESLGWDLDATWAGAQTQTELLETPDAVFPVDIGGVDIVHVFSTRSHTASAVRVVDRLVSEVAEIGGHGAIVAIPSRHTVLAHPIDGADAVRAIAGMIPITRRLFESGPGSVSPHLYWWRDGRLEWIPTFFDGTIDGVDHYPSDELFRLLASLS